MFNIKFAIFVATVLTAAIAKKIPNCHNETYTTAEDAIDGMNYCTYPTGKFNPSCVAESCPDLSKVSLCPLKADGKVNVHNFEKILEIVTKCLKRSTICGTAINSIEIPNYTVNADQLLKGTSLTGSCSVTGDNNFVYNASNTVISLLNETRQSVDPLRLSIEVNQLNYRGTFGCQFGNKYLSEIFGQPLDFKFDNMTYLLIFNIKAFSAVNIASDQIKPSAKASVAQVTVKLSNFNFGIFDPILMVVTNVVTTFVESYLQNSPLTQDFATFIDTIVDNALMFTIQQCKTT